jgi:hypothetical protein
MNQDLFLLLALNYIVYPWLTLTLLMGCWLMVKTCCRWVWSVIRPMWQEGFREF